MAAEKISKNLNNKIRKAVLEVALNIAKKGHGALFVIGDRTKYELLYKNILPRKGISIFDKDFKKVLENFATLDGAVIINMKGEVKAYGARIKNPKTLKGFGTRHAAAYGASGNKQVTVLVSEEEKIVKIFKDEKLLMEINPFTKNISKNVPRIVNILDEATISKISAAGGAGTAAGTAVGITAGGLSTHAMIIGTALGITVLPGVLIFVTVAGTFAGSYYAIKGILKLIQNKARK